jgi:hypothetical protein
MSAPCTCKQQAARAKEHFARLLADPNMPPRGQKPGLRNKARMDYIRRNYPDLIAPRFCPVHGEQ